MHLATEQIRAPELLFQPSMSGSCQAGLAELVEFVLVKFPSHVAEQLANNVFLTGGLAGIQGLQERLQVRVVLQEQEQQKQQEQQEQQERPPGQERLLLGDCCLLQCV